MDRKLGRRRYLKSGVIAAGVSSFAGCLGGGGTEDGSGGGGGGSGDGSGGTVGQGGDGDAGPVTWKFATTNPGTPALSWVNAFAKIVEENTDRLEIEPFTAESFLGALVAVNDGDATLGISDFFAWNALRDGTHPFEEPTPEEGLPRATIPPLHNSGF